MDGTVKILPNFKKYNSYIEDVKQKVNPIMLSGLTDSGKVHFAYSTHFYAERPILLVTYNELQAKKIMKDLAYFSDEILFFPKREIFAYDYLAESKETYYNRMNVLNKLQEGKAKVVVTTIEALMQKMITKEVLYHNCLELKVGQTIELSYLKEILVKMGYDRYDLVEAAGQFSVRGGILDVAISQKRGVRIEFWGDEIDSIRYFELTTQRSTDMVQQIKIFPSSEFLIEDSKEAVVSRILQREEIPEEQKEEDIKQILAGDYITKIDRYFNSFYTKQATLLDYISEEYLVFLDEVSKIKARSENILKDSKAFLKSLAEKKKVLPDAILNLEDYLAFLEKIKEKQTIYLEKQDLGIIDKQTMHAKRNGYSFSYREVNFFRSSMDLLFEEVQKASIAEKYIVILGGTIENSKKIAENLLERNISHKWVEQLDEITPGTVYVTSGVISAGFEAYDFNLLVISGEELFAAPKKKRITNTLFKQAETVVYSDLKPGDYVVHRTNGIGQFLGINTMKADGVVKDYIKIQYKDDDVLYIPTNQLDNIRKYIGSGDTSPKLNRLGSREWINTKQKVKSNLRQVARELIELYAKRQRMQGFAFSKDTPWQTAFEDEFPYTETDDQLRCIEEVKKDMEDIKPMDRLLCGDVGYGKTEVAIRAAFKACMDQKQVAYLVPTTVLANQQYESFKERMENYPIRVELLNRFRTKKEQDVVIKKLKLRRN